MTTWGAIAAIGLGLVFEWSGVAKIASRDAWQVAGTPFSTGSLGLDKAVRSVLPWLEVVVGGLLILRLGTVLAAVVALGMLVAFTVAIVRVLAAGQRPPCMCFGAVRARPVSWMNVARNVALAAIACAAIAGA